MGYVFATLALVGLVQGVAWLGGRATGRRRRAQGALLATTSALVLIGSLLHLGAPTFFDG